jgi:hypothetical protein
VPWALNLGEGNPSQDAGQGRSRGTHPATRSGKACKSGGGRKTPREMGEDPLPMWTVNKHTGLRKLVQCHLPQCAWKGESLQQRLVHRRTLSKQSLQGQVSAKLTPEICINNASSNSRLTAASRVFFFLLPFDETTTKLHLHAEKLTETVLHLAWDTLWGFLFCFVLVFFPFDETTTELPLRHHHQDWGWGTNNKIIKIEILLHLNLEIFFHLFIFYFYLFFFFIFNTLSVSLMPIQLTVD